MLSDLVETLPHFYQIPYPKNFKVCTKLDIFLLNKIFVGILTLFFESHLISRNGLLKACARFIIERSEIRKKQHAFKSVHFECRMVLFYTIWEKSRLQSAFFPQSVEKELENFYLVSFLAFGAIHKLRGQARGKCLCLPSYQKGLLLIFSTILGLKFTMLFLHK